MRRLANIAPTLEKILTEEQELSAPFVSSDIRRDTVKVTTRDGLQLATDLYLPPRIPAPTIALRTPYGRSDSQLVPCFMAFARRGYAVVSQDCRGTGDSEPDTWDYYVYECEDSLDLVEWITRQGWFDGFLGGCGGSYAAQTQWCMGFHPRMSGIAPEVGGLGIAPHSARLHMFLNAYSRAVGKGHDKIGVSYQDAERQMLPETLASGYFNEPLQTPFSEALLGRYPSLTSLSAIEGQRWLWQQYCGMRPFERAELIKEAVGEPRVTAAAVEALPRVFGQHIAHDAHMFPRLEPSDSCALLHAPPLMITGWYDWGLNDALATWSSLIRGVANPVRTRARLLITPSAHNAPGYREGHEAHPELRHAYRIRALVDLILCWYDTVRSGSFDTWPKVIYYLMGANQWHCAQDWPPPGAQSVALYLGSEGTLTRDPPSPGSTPDSYRYDPVDPTPTVGGSIVSSVYRPGSEDISEIQRRSDVVLYTTQALEHDVDVVGSVSLILYAASSAIDTDFVARLSDVFPDGRAIHLQSGMLRARYHNSAAEPALLEPDHVYRFEIDLGATANRFRAGHRIRLDICSANFPKFDRNSNLGGGPGDPVPALQTLFHDAERPSHLLVSVLA